MKTEINRIRTLYSGSPAVSPDSAAGNARLVLLVATLVTVALTYVPGSHFLLYPLRLWVTFIHESGHALAAIASGGNVDSLTVRPDGSGVTLTRAPSWMLWLVFSGGYLGSTLFGATLLQVGRLHRVANAGRLALQVAAAYILFCTLLWAHNPVTNGFTLAVGLALTAGLWLLARVASPNVARFSVAFLAVQCCLNALTDLRDLWFLTSHQLGDNDAVFMSQHYPLPALFWAGTWAIVALGILFVALRGYWRGTAASPTPQRLGA